jgi:hypothetical protein
MSIFSSSTEQVVLLQGDYNTEDCYETKLKHLKYELDRLILSENKISFLAGNVFPKISEITDKLKQDMYDLNVIPKDFKPTHAAIGNPGEVFGILKDLGYKSNFVMHLDDSEVQFFGDLK